MKGKVHGELQVEVKGMKKGVQVLSKKTGQDGLKW